MFKKLISIVAISGMLLAFSPVAFAQGDAVISCEAEGIVVISFEIPTSGSFPLGQFQAWKDGDAHIFSDIADDQTLQNDSSSPLEIMVDITDLTFGTYTIPITTNYAALSMPDVGSYGMVLRSDNTAWADYSGGGSRISTANPTGLVSGLVQLTKTPTLMGTIAPNSSETVYVDFIPSTILPAVGTYSSTINLLAVAL